MNAALRDVVFTFSYVTWDGAMRRHMSFAQDRLAVRLLEHERVRRLVVADSYRSLPFAAARAALMRDGQPFPHDGRTSHHRPMRLRRRDPVRVSAVESTYRAYDHRLRKAAERAGLVRPSVITAHPLVAGFAPLDWAGPVTYFATDDWRGSPEYRRYWPIYDEAYRRLREAGRRVGAVSRPIIDRIDPTGPSAVIANGVDPMEWPPPRPGSSWLSTLPGPRILYLGTLDGRIDADLVAALADRFPNGSIALVGPTRDAEHIDRCAAAANVYVRPPVQRRDVPSLLADADLCVIPHVRNRFTTAMSPLKLYEYLAAGRPVAAVDLGPIRDVDERVVITDGDKTFVEAAAQALALGPATEAERQQFLARNSWDRRHERLLELALAD